MTLNAISKVVLVVHFETSIWFKKTADFFLRRQD
jgi:hypothetical protein